MRRWIGKIMFGLSLGMIILAAIFWVRSKWATDELGWSSAQRHMAVAGGPEGIRVQYHLAGGAGAFVRPWGWRVATARADGLEGPKLSLHPENLRSGAPGNASVCDALEMRTATATLRVDGRGTPVVMQSWRRFEARRWAKGWYLRGDHPVLGRWQMVAVPYWAILAAGLLWPAWRGWKWARRRWKKRPGYCPKCGYDLRATPEKCPECGRDVTEAERKAMGTA